MMPESLLPLGAVVLNAAAVNWLGLQLHQGAAGNPKRILAYTVVTASEVVHLKFCDPWQQARSLQHGRDIWW